ncbi:hypothetical protein QEN19_000990 [Hanseniaspora menglaensis]
MIYGRKGSVQLRIFHNKETTKDGKLEINKENSLDLQTHHHCDSENKNLALKDCEDSSKKDIETNKPVFNTSNLFYEPSCQGSKSKRFITNKPLYLDSDDLLKESDEFVNHESVIEEDILELEPLENVSCSADHVTISRPYTKTNNSADSLDNKLAASKRRTSSSGYNKFIELEPFKNKVGGHTEIYKFSKRAICKTLVNRENEWYEQLEYQYTSNNNEFCGILLKFMPRYIGILNVRKHLMETEVTMNDNIHLFSQKLLEKYNICVDVDGLTEECHKTNINTTLKDQILTEVFNCAEQPFENISVGGKEKLETLLSLQNDSSNSEVCQYILLEDLTRKMKHATVLDLKMGTRQYGVYANEKKKKSQTLKCKLTTSNHLGCRVCGMKIYRQADDSFIKRDKYFGRRIRIGWQFARVLLVFLYDGISQQSILKKIPKLLEDLKELKTAFENLPGYRMYGASLLFMYDNRATECNIYLIDFAQCVTKDKFIKEKHKFTCKPTGDVDSTDSGFIKGLSSLEFYLQKAWNMMTDSYDLKNFKNDQYGTLDLKKVNQFCQQEKFNKAFEWLDSFEKENEQEYNDDTCEMRKHWANVEEQFNIAPQYVSIANSFVNSE